MNWWNILSIPQWLIVHVNSKANHCHTATNSRDEWKWPTTTPSQWYTSNDGKEESYCTKKYCASVFVHLCARVFKDFNSIEGDGVNTRKLIHHEVNDENSEGLQTRRSQKSLKDFFRCWFATNAKNITQLKMLDARFLSTNSLFGICFVCKLLKLVNFSLNVVRTSTKLCQAFESFFWFLMCNEIVGWFRQNIHSDEGKNRYHAWDCWKNFPWKESTHGVLEKNTKTKSNRG